MFVGEEALDAGGVRKVKFSLAHSYALSIMYFSQVVFFGEEAIDDGGVKKV